MVASADSLRFALSSDKWPAQRLPEALFRQPVVIGIDEAGRGPVLGPLVYALFAVPADEESALRAMGAADSKAVTAQAREAFFDALLAGTQCQSAGWLAHALHPERISNCMLGIPRTNLNELSFDTVFELVRRAIAAGVRISKGFVDTLGKPEKYEQRLTAQFPGIKWTVRSKADALFPVVGAASIVAKVIRDDILSHCFAAANGLPITASGYPGDPQTVAFLRESVDHVFGFPRAVRFSWSSCNALLESECCAVRWEDCDDAENTETIIDKRDSSRKLAAKRPLPKSVASPIIAKPSKAALVLSSL